MFTDMYSPLSYGATYQVFLGAPNLRDVEIVDYWPGTSLLETFAMPVEQLISLDIAAMEPEYDLTVYVDILHRCNSLTKLAYCIPFPSDPGLVGFTPNLSITLPALKSLDVTCYEGHHSVLSCLTVPLLEELTLQWQGQDHHDIYTDIASLRNRSLTSLSSLTLNHFLADQKFTREMIAILSILPELTSFSIVGCTTDLNPLVRAITYSKGQQVLLPKLKRFSFLPFEDQGYPLKMTAMILSRCWLDSDKGELPQRKGLTRLEKVVLPGSLFAKEISTRIFNFPGLNVEYDWDW